MRDVEEKGNRWRCSGWTNTGFGSRASSIFFSFLSRFLFDVEILIDCMLLLTYLSLCCFIFYPQVKI